jgi:ribosomal protein S4E
MVLSPLGLRPERDCSGEDQQQITDSSSRQRKSYKITTPQLSKANVKEKLVADPKWGPDTNIITLTLTFFVQDIPSYQLQNREASSSVLSRGIMLQDGR